MRKQQTGVMLLEAMIAILIFSLGVLGVVGMQAMAIGASRDAKYRSEAALYANELIGQMWASKRNGAELKTAFQGDGASTGSNDVVSGADGAEYNKWKDRVLDALPGAADNPPQVQIVPGQTGLPRTGSVVNVQVRWKAPGDASVHNYQVNVQIF